MGEVLLSKAANYINLMRQVGSIDSLDRLLLDECIHFGVERAASVMIGKAGQPLSLGRIVGTAKQDWVERYRLEGFVRKDPAAKRAISSVTPFSWCEAKSEAANDEHLNLVFDAAREHGITNGFVVPVHNGDGSLAVVTFCGDHIADDRESRSYMHLLAIYYHAAAERLLMYELANDNPLITKRQIECLKWVAAGKTDWEIGSILGLSEATINRHIERAKERLGVRTRVQAVVEALTKGVLNF